MNNVSAALPRKNMTDYERSRIRRLKAELRGVRVSETVKDELLDLILAWQGSRSPHGFEVFTKQWLAEGNAKSKAAEEWLRDLFEADNSPEAA